MIRKQMQLQLLVGTPVLLKHCAFTERHKLKDHFASDQYIVVKSNVESDVYAIRPMAGGPEKWVNIKLLVLDPRGVLRKLAEPLSNLPCVDGTQYGDSDHSDSESEEELVISAHPGLCKLPETVREPDALCRL